jgi:thioredoxin-like negative regulator of GroEL
MNVLGKTRSTFRKRSLLASIFLLLLGVLVHLLPVAATPAALEQAVTMYKGRRYSEAIAQFDAYAKQPAADQTTAHYYMGLCYQCLNQVGRAQSEYQWVVDNGRDQALRGYAQTAIDQLAAYKGRRSYQGLAVATGAKPRAVAGASKSNLARYPTHGRPVVLDFSTSWCGWCKKMEPTVDVAQSRFSGRIEFQKLDGDDPDNQELKSRYGVTGYPCFILLDSKGQFVNKVSGYKEEDAFVAQVEQLVGR